jgi:hypothetical protein
MSSILAHGGTAGLAAEIFLLSLPVLGFGLLWWWNRRLGRREAAAEVAERAAPSAERPPSAEGPPPA